MFLHKFAYCDKCKIETDKDKYIKMEFLMQTNLTYSSKIHFNISMSNTNELTITFFPYRKKKRFACA